MLWYAPNEATASVLYIQCLEMPHKVSWCATSHKNGSTVKIASFCWLFTPDLDMQLVKSVYNLHNALLVKKEAFRLQLQIVKQVTLRTHVVNEIS